MFILLLQLLCLVTSKIIEYLVSCFLFHFSSSQARSYVISLPLTKKTIDFALAVENTGTFRWITALESAFVMIPAYLLYCCFLIEVRFSQTRNLLNCIIVVWAHAEEAGHDYITVQIHVCLYYLNNTDTSAVTAHWLAFLHIGNLVYTKHHTVLNGLLDSSIARFWSVKH